VRLFFDEQFSEDLSKLLRDIFPNSLHIRQMGAGGATGATVWQLAKTHGCLLVSKDEDFHRLSLLLGAPPKVIWIRRGNCSTEEIAQLLRQRHAHIEHFAEQEEVTFLELG
jgi:predicted nuclease of predicted toxin-antitoxin system